MIEISGGGKIPGVSIGLPVFNGQKHLKEALDLLLKQEYTDFELIISDNGSTDNTEKICREYAAQDPRIIYVRRDRNYGIMDNFKKVLALARAPYFMWAAYDDQRHPRFISACRERLEANPKAVLATPAVKFITMDGNPMEKQYPPLHTAGMDIRSRVAIIFNDWGIGFNFYGLYRREALQKIVFDINCYAADIVMLLQLMFHGEVEYVPEILFTYRFTIRSTQSYAALDDPGHKRESWSPRIFTVLTINLLRAIVNAPVDASLRRVLLSDALAILAFKSAYWRQMLLQENSGFLPFIDPAAHGFFPQTETNLVTGLAALLLPYCWPGAPFGAVDLSDLDTFEKIPSGERLKPCPGQKEFVTVFLELMKASTHHEAIAFYDRFRLMQPVTEGVKIIDDVIAKLRPA